MALVPRGAGVRFGRLRGSGSTVREDWKIGKS